MPASRARVGVVARVVGTIGAWFIYALIRVFGRARRRDDIGWLVGPLGGKVIGDLAYRETAEREGLELDRSGGDGGLIPSFDVLAGPDFDPAAIHPLVREFYEHTTRFAIDVWSRTYFPASVALWLLVKTISKQVDQLNFPLTPLETARGMVSEVILLRRPDGTVRYSGWFRSMAESHAVIYTGFYMTEHAPGEGRTCVKAVFPMPNGNATVVLRPEVDRGALVLDSSGHRFGDAGFYRVQARGDGERLQVWHIRSLKEHFRIYVDDAGTLRGDHRVHFLGMPVLALHYKMTRRV